MIYYIEQYTISKGVVDFDGDSLPFSDKMHFLKSEGKPLLLKSDKNYTHRQITQIEYDDFIINDVDPKTETQLIQEEVDNLTMMLADVIGGAI